MANLVKHSSLLPIFWLIL